MLDLEKVLSPVYVRPGGLETNLSDSDIVPDEVQAELIQWRDAFSAGAFRIGDIANEMIIRASTQGWSVTNDRIYKAVGKFCGKSGRTIRYYSETSAFYPVNIRNKYDVLPFSHFVFARTKGDDWELVLEYASEHPESSLSEITVHFENVGRFSHDRDWDADVPQELREYSQQYARSLSRANVVGDLLTALDKFERELPRLYEGDPVGASDMAELIATMRKWARNLTTQAV